MSQIPLVVVACALAWACICRLSLMSKTTTQWPFVLLYAAGFAGSAFVVLTVYILPVSDWHLLTSLAWALTSQALHAESWSRGLPPYVRKRLHLS